LKVCGEIEFRVRQNLLAKLADSPNTYGADLSKIVTVFSHAQSLAQCASWLNANLPNAHREAVESNAEAARLASTTPNTAAIAGELAAQEFALEICAAGIEDNPNNTTRFWVLGRKETPPSGRDKTSLAVAVQHSAGSMHHTIEPFAKHGVSMAHIESRPLPGSQWEYLFLIDLEGHATDPALATALAEVKQRARMFKVLGAYPKAIA
jgi:chorismate mutase / prephenate dehydratase